MDFTFKPFERTSPHPDFTNRGNTRDFDFTPPQPTSVGFQEITYRSLLAESAPKNHFQMQLSGEAGEDLTGLDMPSFPFANKVQQQHQQQQDVALSAKLFSIQMAPALSLKPLPVWIENHTSFISTPQADPQILLQALQEALNRGPACVDVVVNAEKGKLKGIVSQQGRYARFQIRLYAYAKGVVVEFQRREGDAMLLSGMFQNVMVALGPELVARRWDSAAIAAPPPTFPMDLPPELEKSPVNILSTLDNLMALSESPLIDHQKEAVSGLVTLSAEHGHLLAEAACTTRPLLLILIKLLASHNLIDVVRGSAVCLSNLLQAYSDMCKPGRKRAAPSAAKFSMDNCQALLASMLENLRSPAVLESLDTKRHISKSLQSLAKAHPHLLASDRGCVITLNKFKSSKDAVLRAHVLDTLQLIQSSA
jgi:hypothetical protein